jgi:uncharacterized membrane protein YcaP (DUF421 family)
MSIGRGIEKLMMLLLLITKDLIGRLILLLRLKIQDHWGISRLSFMDGLLMIILCSGSEVWKKLLLKG